MLHLWSFDLGLFGRDRLLASSNSEHILHADVFPCRFSIIRYWRTLRRGFRRCQGGLLRCNSSCRGEISIILIVHELRALGD
jgi:hypothetical protein